MSQATQVFNGVMFVTNPFLPRSFLRVDILEKKFAEIIERISKDALSGCGQNFEPYETRVLSSLRARAASLQFPHDEMFKREAQRKGFKLDDKNYLAAQAASLALMEELYEDAF
jgi:hypothetical protein